MAGRELELAIKIGGYLTSKFTESYKSAAGMFQRLGDTGEQAAEKLDCIKNVETNQMRLAAQTGKLRDAYGKLSAATQNLEKYAGKSETARARLTRRQEEARAKTAQLLQKTRELAKKNIEYKNTVEKLHGPINNLIRDQERLAKASSVIVLSPGSQNFLYLRFACMRQQSPQVSLYPRAGFLRRPLINMISKI